MFASIFKWNEAAHPRHPAGNSKGGEFAPKGVVDAGPRTLSIETWEYKNPKEYKLANLSTFINPTKSELFSWAGRDVESVRWIRWGESPEKGNIIFWDSLEALHEQVRMALVHSGVATMEEFTRMEIAMDELKAAKGLQGTEGHYAWGDIPVKLLRDPKHWDQQLLVVKTDLHAIVKRWNEANHSTFSTILKSNPYHDERGRFTTAELATAAGGVKHSHVRSKVGMYYDKNAEQWLFDDNDKKVPKEDVERLKALGVPPGWTGVVLNSDPDGDPGAIGLDAANRLQYRFSAEHQEESAVEKYARLKDLVAAIPGIRAAVNRDLNSSDEKIREHARAIYLIDKTAFRIGSSRDTGGKEDAFGATTLLSSHVKIKGDTVEFKFASKKGVPVEKKVQDVTLARVMAAQVKGKKAKETLFSRVSDQSARLYLKKISGNDEFKVHDFRTFHATALALKLSKSYSMPSTIKELKTMKKEIGSQVGVMLGHADGKPGMALKSYIDPMVWKNFTPKLPESRVIKFSAILKFNPYHDERGRFTSEDNATNGTGDDSRLSEGLAWRALDDYLQNTHDSINAHLRGQRKYKGVAAKEAKEDVEALRYAFRSPAMYKETKNDMVVFRGISNDRVYKKLLKVKRGDVITDKAFLSTTQNMETAHHAARGRAQAQVVLQINVPKGVKYLKGRREEKELLFDAGTRLRITSKVRAIKATKYEPAYLYLYAEMLK